MSTDALTVHPEFDVATATWFVSGMEYEAPTLARLQEQLGPQVIIRDYYPMSRPIAAAFLRRVLPPTLEPMTVLQELRPGNVRRQIGVGQGARRQDGKPKIRIDHALLTQLWNEGMRTSLIAERLGTTKNGVISTVGAMRRRGANLVRR